jgi:hypothetical protein
LSAHTLDAHASLLARKWQLLEKREADEKKAAQKERDAHDAHASLLARKKKAAQKERDAVRRQLIMVVATCVSLLIATVAMLSLTIWWVRVRRVAHRYQVTVAATQTWSPLNSRLAELTLN